VSRHPVICNPVLDPVVDILDYVAWRAGDNELPVISGSLGVLDAGQAYTITTSQLLAMASDSVHALSVTGLGVTSVSTYAGNPADLSKATLADNMDGTWTLTLAAAWSGTVDLALSITDGKAVVSGTISGTVEHVLWKNSGDTLADLTYNPALLSIVPDPDGGSHIRAIAYSTSHDFYKTDMLTCQSEQLLRMSWHSASTNSAVRIWGMVGAATQKIPLGDSAFEFTTGEGQTQLQPYFFIIDVQPGDEVYLDDFRLVLLNSRPAVSGTVDLGAMQADDTALWTADQFLAVLADPDGDALTITDLTVSAGSVVDNGNGTWTYTAKGWANVDVDVTVTATDGIATVTVTGYLGVYDMASTAAAWESAQEWTLNARNPYHPAVETGANLGYLTPLDLGAKLKRWADSFDLSRITMSGSEISSYGDRMGGPAVTQGTISYRPRYRSAGEYGLNGRPCIYYDGGDSLALASGAGLPIGTAARGHLTIYQPSRTTGSNTVMQQGANATGYRFSLQFRQTPVGDPYFSGYNSDLSSGDAVTLDIKSSAVDWAGDGGLLRIYKNGLLKAAANRTLNTTPDSLSYGSGPAGVEAMMGLKGDDVHWSGTLTAPEIEWLTAWLHWKYGVQDLLPADNPWRTARPRRIALGTEDGLTLGTEDGQAIRLE